MVTTETLFFKEYSLESTIILIQFAYKSTSCLHVAQGVFLTGAAPIPIQDENLYSVFTQIVLMAV